MASETTRSFLFVREWLRCAGRGYLRSCFQRENRKGTETLN